VNIKEHIAAGHYPAHTLLDKHAWWVVPMQCGRTARIYSIMHTNAYPIVGSLMDGGEELLMEWTANGSCYATKYQCAVGSFQLEPPPPREVLVKMYYAIDKFSLQTPKACRGTTENASLANEWKRAGWTVIELTGKYEEEWK
jgi:hypothetical protein